MSIYGQWLPGDQIRIIDYEAICPVMDMGVGCPVMDSRQRLLYVQLWTWEQGVQLWTVGKECYMSSYGHGS